MFASSRLASPIAKGRRPLGLGLERGGAAGRWFRATPGLPLCLQRKFCVSSRPVLLPWEAALRTEPSGPLGNPAPRAPGAGWVWEWVLARGPRGAGASGDPARSSRAGRRAMSSPSGIWDTGACGRLVIRLSMSLGETRGQGLCYSACSASSKGPGRPSSPAPHFTRTGGDRLPSCS